MCFTDCVLYCMMFSLSFLPIPSCSCRRWFAIYHFITARVGRAGASGCNDQGYIMHLSICNINIPPGHTPGHLNFFYFQRSNSPPSGPKRCSNAPHVRPVGWANAPPLGPFLGIVSKQYAISTGWSFSN